MGVKVDFSFKLKPKLNKNFQDILRKIEKLSRVVRLVERMVRRASLVIRMA